MTGFGGNPGYGTGQIVMDAAAHPIPLPTGADGMNTMRIHITAGSADVYVGGAGVTTGTGHRIVANTTQWFTTRSPLSLIGASGTATYFYEFG